MTTVAMHNISPPLFKILQFMSNPILEQGQMLGFRVDYVIFLRII